MDEMRAAGLAPEAAYRVKSEEEAENEGQTPYASIQHTNIGDNRYRPSIFEQLSTMEQAPLIENGVQLRLPAVDDDDDGLDEPIRLPPIVRHSLATPEIFIRSPSSETLRSRKSSDCAGGNNPRRGQDLF
uniref:Uncharacterized protein n=1 Tax=Plectus sambesii TaxID=2011161 RepID=A0A914WM26_9BILA